MELTAFFPFFMAMLLWALRSPRHWLATTGFACFLQGASPVILSAGGRLSGMAPAYMLVGVGLLHYLLRQKRALPDNNEQRWSAPHIWIWVFTLIGVTGALLLPRVFEGVAHALDPRGTLNTTIATVVVPSGTNVIQAFYLLLNVAVFSLASHFVARDRDGIRHALNGVAAGLAFACAMAVYQLVAHYTGLPWPREIINSNTGVGQFPDQMAGSLKRLTSTFWEPSLLGYNFVGCLGVFLLGKRNPVLGAVALCVLLLSTSSLGYFGFVALLAFWFLLQREGPTSGAKWRVALAVVALATTFIVIDQVALDGIVLTNMVLNKGATSSGVSRSYANWMALQTFLESAGIGVGVGSARASSFIATIMATMGVPGLLAFAAFAATLVIACFRAGDRDSMQLFYGLVGLLLVWAMAIPDFVQALFWFLAGVAAGHLKRTAPQSAAARPETFACAAK